MTHWIWPLVLVGVGSMAGGLSRYALGLLTQNAAAAGLPWGTLASNLAGCLVVGILAGFGARFELLSTELRLLLATGFCGGFTTLSSFVYELNQQVHDQDYLLAGFYFTATLAGAGLAFMAGLMLSHAIPR